jgi:hypothetical protein
MLTHFAGILQSKYNQQVEDYELLAGQTGFSLEGTKLVARET